MRNNDGFIAGMVAGMALGALVVAASMPSVRRPVMRGAGQLGDRMGKMMRRGRNMDLDEMVEQMIPGDMT